MSYTIKVILTNPPLATVNPMGEWAKEQVKEAVIGGLEGIKDILLELSYSFALVGGGICVLLWLSGWRNGNRWAGILFIAHVLVRFLLGGI